MEAFYYIGQKIYNKSNKFFSTKNLSGADNFSFWNEIHRNEYIINNNIVNIFLYSLMDSNSDKLLKESKFSFLKKYISYIFLDEEKIENILIGFSNIQRVYIGFSRIAYLYKFKKAETIIKTDLMLNDIDSTKKNVITIMQNGHKYMFTIQDVLKIIKNAICNTPHYFSESLPFKNPYNNIIFNKSTLYNIYFFVKDSNLIMPDYLQNFFLCDFNLLLFMDTNETIIRTSGIKSKIDNLLDEEKYGYIVSMIYFYNRFQSKSRKIIINKNMPRKFVIDIFKSYLYLFMMYRYSNCNTTQENYRNLLFRKLKVFSEGNPRFGFYTIKKRQYGKAGYVLSFNINHIKHEGNNWLDDFLINHSFTDVRQNSLQDINTIVIRNVDVEIDSDIDDTSSSSSSSSRTLINSNNNDDEDDDNITVINEPGTGFITNVNRSLFLDYDDFLSDDGTTLDNLFENIGNNIDEIIENLNSSIINQDGREN